MEECSAGSLHSVDSAVAVAAKTLTALPLHQLLGDLAGASDSPPKHRRGDVSSPRGASKACSQLLLKQKASGVMAGVEEGAAQWPEERLGATGPVGEAMLKASAAATSEISTAVPEAAPRR